MKENMCDTPSFEEFANKVFPGLSVGSFHKTYYAVLQAFAEGIIRRLIVTIPPQHGKSLGASQLLPAYLLGLNPDLHIAIASYSSSLASRFNKRVQRIIDSTSYVDCFPETTIKSSKSKNSDYVRCADHVEVIGREGELMSVGREGSLTGNRVDIFILDDLYKDVMEANSPVVRENCWDWYVSVVRTRMHNESSELIVFTRWHQEDLIGMIMEREKVTKLVDINQIGEQKSDEWFLLNFEALKVSLPSQIDPRKRGEPLWPERHNLKTLENNRKLDPYRFESMYQGNPSPPIGLLYGCNFHTYNLLPNDVVRWANYTDTADTGDDYLCSICYAVDKEGRIYIVDMIYSREGMEVTEKLVAEMLAKYPSCDVLVESNNGGRGFARALSRQLPALSVKWFHQSANKEARILSNSTAVTKNILLPSDWRIRWDEFASHVMTYQRVYRNNRWHDAADVLTGIVEREVIGSFNKKIRSLTFSK